MTKKDLIELLEKYPDDTKLTVGEYCEYDLVINECIFYGHLALNFGMDFGDD
jgi:hypothetical protein